MLFIKVVNGDMDMIFGGTLEVSYAMSQLSASGDPHLHKWPCGVLFRLTRTSKTVFVVHASESELADGQRPGFVRAFFAQHKE